MIEGEHYRRLSVREGGGRYRFVLLRDVVFIHPHFVLPLAHHVSFRDKDHHEWMAMTCRTQTVRADYAWNGNSPKIGFRLFGRDVWLGTMDFKPTIPSSGKHDPDFQFRKCEHFPFSLTVVNQHYRELLGNFRLANSYAGALADFSPKIWNSPAASDCYSVLL